tara:strand:+ start:668 stop:859 length:192 start_codon:yes stop_codon:yes gene_type:complete
MSVSQKRGELTMNAQKMVEIIEAELRFVSKNPNARHEKTASEYAQRLVDFIDRCQEQQCNEGK